MNFFGGFSKAAAFGAAVLIGVASQASFADTFAPTYLGPGVQTPTGITTNYNTFDGLTYNGSSLVTNFNGSSITGTYTGSVQIENASQFGGAGGVGQYIAPPNGGSYTLTLSQQVNYFGMWFSALDQGNQLSFYNNGILVYSFSPTDYSQLVGACPTSAPSPNYCGNPNSAFSGQDSEQQFAYLNFYDTTGTFNEIVFTEDPAVGEFESDNQAVAMIGDTTPPVGTPLTGVTPEPSTFVLLGTGIAGAFGAMRRRFAK
jgi:hypothetical protein